MSNLIAAIMPEIKGNLATVCIIGNTLLQEACYVPFSAYRITR
jgi:hypothetical protein